MIKITELKKGKLSIYRYERIEDDVTIEQRIIKYPIAYINNKWLLYNDNMGMIEPFIKYVNDTLKNYASNTKQSKAYNLRLFYIFCEIFNVDIEKVTMNDLNKLSVFLKGYSSDNNEINISFLTQRSRTTILHMISDVKNFLYCSGFDTKAFECTNNYMLISKSSMPSKKHLLNGDKYSYCKTEVPKYITTEDYLNIINYIKKDKQPFEIRLRNQCIVKLMFEGGLRLGEALGLTLEDIEIISKSSGEELGRIILRNRLTDKPYQCAKGCMKVHHPNNYKGSEYKTFNVGFQYTYISIETYDLLEEYIDLVHGKGMKNRNKHKYEKAKADAIDQYKLQNLTNYYIFLNQWFTPLSNVTWNKYLREVFEAIGLEVNYIKKKDNLSHRFRHGFAMHLIYDCNYPIEMVQKRMRHKSITSTEVYNNPTSQDIIDHKEAIEEDYIMIGEAIKYD